MSNLVKNVYVPRFGSQLRSSQTHELTEYQINLPPMCSPEKRSENRLSSKRGFRNYATNKKVNKKATNGNQPVASPTPQYSRSMSQARRAVGFEKQDTHPTSQWSVFDPDCEGDLSPSQPIRRHTTDTNEQFKPDVLRTISKMLHENRCIRQRLLSLSQSSCRLTRDPPGSGPPTRGRL